MGVVKPRVRVKDSKHDLVFSHDPDVIAPTYAGWIPPSVCGGVNEGADVLTVRGMTAPQLAGVLDVGMGSASHSANLLASSHMIVAVNGDETPKVIHEWMDAAFRSNPEVIAALAIYGKKYAQGGDPVTANHDTCKEVFGPLPTFHDAAPAAE